MPLIRRSSRWSALLFLTVAGFAYGDPVSTPDGPSAHGDFAMRKALPAAPEQASGTLTLNIPQLLVHASRYWEGWLDRRSESRSAAVDVAQLFGGPARLNDAEFVWLALVKETPQLERRFVQLQRDLPWGTETLPIRLARSSGFSRPPGSGVPVNTKPDARMLKMEHREPWSPAAALFYRGFITVTIVAILIVFWLRDQIKAQFRRTV